MARLDAMAAIDRALNPPPKIEEAQQQEETTPTSPLPGVEPLPKPEKKKRAQKTEAARQQEAIEQTFARTPDVATRRDVNLSGIQKAYNAFWSTLTNVGNATKGGLEALPTPGSIAIPLILLLVFFFLLIPINGHTRFVWLWLVLSGNAEISPSQGATVAGGTFSEQVPSQPPTVTLSQPILGISFMTGAGEDFL